MDAIFQKYLQKVVAKNEILSLTLVVFQEYITLLVAKTFPALIRLIIVYCVHSFATYFLLEIRKYSQSRHIFNNSILFMLKDYCGIKYKEKFKDHFFTETKLNQLVRYIWNKYCVQFSIKFQMYNLVLNQNRLFASIRFFKIVFLEKDQFFWKFAFQVLKLLMFLKLHFPE